tara:strand:- start:39378 stop:40397 length:1020 start_codon:yes stop_codon:yes gene_type:complete
MLTNNEISMIDSQNMHSTYDNWPEIAKEYFSKNYSKIEVNDVDHIVFAGMGGSGTIGDVFSSILSKTDMHVSIIKGYELPKTVDKNSVIILTSISGNTQETLSILENSNKTNAKILALSSGGMMEKICNNNKINFYKIEKQHSPRASFLGFLYASLNILEDIIPVKKSDIDESIQSLFNIKKSISSENLNENNEALEIANWLKNTPVMYYPWGLQSAAIRFKNSMQENAKTHVMIEDVIEMCHNGIVAWNKPKKFQPILLQGKDDHIKTKERWKIIKEFFQEKNVNYKEIISQEGSVLSKIVTLVYLLDYVSIYNAIISKIDPTPVEEIDFIKRRLGKL